MFLLRTHAPPQAIHLQRSHLVLSSGGKRGQETEAVISPRLIEGATVVCPPRLSQPLCHAHGGGLLYVL